MTAASFTTPVHPEAPPAPRNRWVWVTVLALVSIACGAFAQSTARDGLIESPDSVVYLGAASNMHAGKGATVPISTVSIDVSPSRAVPLAGRVPLVQFPPVFPFVLSLLGHAGLSPPDAARALNPTLFGLNLFLIGLLVVALVGERRWAWALPVLAVLVCGAPRFERAPMLLLHGSVLSEPLMFTWILASLLAVAAALRTHRAAWFVPAAVFAGLATGTRFVGVAMVLAVMVAVLTWGPGRLTARASWASLVGVVGVVPTALFVAAQQHRLHGNGHPLVIGSAVDALQELASGAQRWFLPTSASTPARVALLVVVGVVCLVMATNQRSAFRLRGADRDRRAMRALVVVLSVAYTGVVVASRLVFDQNVALWGRHLELLWILLLVIAADLLSDVDLPRPAHVTLVLVAIGAAVAVSLPGGTDLARVHSIGFRPLAADPPDRRFVIAVEAVPRRALIFTNTPENVFLDGGRAALMVPCRRNYYTHDRNRRYRTDVAELVALVRSGRAVLLLSDLSPLGSPGCFDGRDATKLGLAKGRSWAGGATYRAHP